MDSIARQSDASRQAALRSVTILANGSWSDFDAAFTSDAVNHESVSEPPSSRGVGPDAFYGTALWLRAAFDDLAYDIKHTAVEGDLVALDAMMSGRHTGAFVLYDPDGRVQTVQAPTGRTFTTRQTHWFRVVDDQVAEHWAVRDDLGPALQLGWVPPTPLHLFRSARAKRAAQRQNAWNDRPARNDALGLDSLIAGPDMELRIPARGAFHSPGAENDRPKLPSWTAQTPTWKPRTRNSAKETGKWRRRDAGIAADKRALQTGNGRRNRAPGSTHLNRQPLAGDRIALLRDTRA